MGNAINDKETQMHYIQNRMDMLLKVLDAIDPKTAGVEEIDRIIGMLDELELKCKQFRHDWEE
ncbi:SE1561 family protein [Pseudalkalibacillus decolorationis]|uniref:SE1561 family protein n=1 Tax=Pseudalkalibacillus decolorationis TaxID=163879 RepID=UPI002149183A|nr:SE1561 family protein [Pseudalkalibacillus decolorationis]